MHCRKVNFFVLFSILILTYVFLPITSTYAEERYKWIDSNNTESYFFDTATIKFTKDLSDKVNTNQIDVWIRIEYNSAGVQDRISVRKKNNIPTDGYENLSFTLRHTPFDIKNSKYSTLEIYDYDKYGNILDKHQARYVEWESIIPGSNSEYWLQEIKSYVITNWDSIMSRSKY